MYLLFYGHVVQELDERCDKVLNIAAFCCKVAAYDISVVRHMNISAELQIRRFILHTVLCEVPFTYGHFLESMMYNNFVGICLLLLSKLQMLSAAYCNCIRCCLSPVTCYFTLQGVIMLKHQCHWIQCYKLGCAHTNTN